MEYTIYASLILITLMCLWAIISIPKNYLFKSLLVPVMIGIAISTWYTYNAILGYGTEFKPTHEVVYHSHVADKKADKIFEEKFDQKIFNVIKNLIISFSSIF